MDFVLMCWKITHMWSHIEELERCWLTYIFDGMLLLVLWWNLIGFMNNQLFSYTGLIVYKPVNKFSTLTNNANISSMWHWATCWLQNDNTLPVYLGIFDVVNYLGVVLCKFMLITSFSFLGVWNACLWKLGMQWSIYKLVARFF